MSYDYEKDLDIDLLRLEVDWQRQPALFNKWATLAADAAKASKLADERVKTVRSELSMNARKDVTLLPGGKATEAAIEEFYRTHPDYIQAVQDRIDLEYEAEMLLNAVQAFRMKSVALENEVKLVLGGYFAAPRISKDTPVDPAAVEKFKEEAKEVSVADAQAALRARREARQRTRG